MKEVLPFLQDFGKQQDNHGFSVFFKQKEHKI